MNIPTAEELRKQVVAAKDKRLDPVRAAGDKLLVDFGAHVTALLLDPSRFTTHTIFTKPMPAGAYYDTGYWAFIDYVREKLGPLGYKVDQSHDGGMYSTILVSWESPEKKPYGRGNRPVVPNHRREYGSEN